MVVLSAAVCTKNGKALLSRQFLDMSRIRIEGLLAAFPKLMGTGAGTQHTFIETDSVRYVYQPIEDLFLLLITNKASNIVEDLETLRLLSKLLPEVAGGVSEDRIMDKMLELVFAFDEVLTTGGHRENITMAQIQTNLTMDSHEEKLHKMIEQTKIGSAKEEADRKAKAFREEKRQQKMAGIGGGSAVGGGIEGGQSSTPGDTYSDKHMSGGDGQFNSGGGVGGVESRSGSPYGVYSAGRAAEPEVVPKKGMQLGGGSKKQSMMDKLVSEDNLAPLAPIATASSGGSSGSTAAPVALVPDSYPVMIVLEEKVSATLNREGALESMEVKGAMQLTATEDDACKCQVVMTGTKNALFAFQTHPKVDKKAYESQNLLVLKDAAKGFPKAKSVGVLRWSVSTQDDSQVPISINCWPEPDGAEMNVNVEYTVEKEGTELSNVIITIPLGTNAPPNVISCDSGNYRHNRTNEELVWEIELIDSANKSGALEFNVAIRDSPDSFFPIDVAFSSQGIQAGVAVGSVQHCDSGQGVQYGVTTSVTTESYKVE